MRKYDILDCSCRKSKGKNKSDCKCFAIKDGKKYGKVPNDVIISKEMIVW